MTLLVDEEGGQVMSLEEISVLETRVPGKLKIHRRGCRNFVIMSAAVSVLMFLASLAVLIYVMNLLKTPPFGTNQQEGGIVRVNSLFILVYAN